MNSLTSFNMIEYLEQSKDLELECQIFNIETTINCLIHTYFNCECSFFRDFVFEMASELIDLVNNLKAIV